GHPAGSTRRAAPPSRHPTASQPEVKRDDRPKAVRYGQAVTVRLTGTAGTVALDGGTSSHPRGSGPTAQEGMTAQTKTAAAPVQVTCRAPSTRGLPRHQSTSAQRT